MVSVVGGVLRTVRVKTGRTGGVLEVRMPISAAGGERQEENKVTTECLRFPEEGSRPAQG